MYATKVNRTETYDRMVLTIKLPSGGTLKWAINRNSERLEVGFSNDPVILKQQSKTVKDYLEGLKGTNKERFDAIEKLAREFQSGATLVKYMQSQLLIKA